MKRFFAVLIAVCAAVPVAAGNEKTVYPQIAAEISALRPKLKHGTMAVIPFDAAGFPDPARGVYVSDKISAAIAEMGKITLVEREKLNSILKEKELAMAGVIDQDDARRIGALLSIDAIVMGRVYKTRDGSDIMVKVVDAPTGKVLLAFSRPVTGEPELRGVKALPWYAGTWKVTATAPYLAEQDMRYEKVILNGDDTFSLFLVNNADRLVEIRGRYRVEKNNINYRAMQMFFDGSPMSFTRPTRELEGTIYLVEGRLYFNYAGAGGKQRKRHDAMEPRYRCVAERQPD